MSSNPKLLSFLLAAIFLIGSQRVVAQSSCDPSVPSFTVNLSSSPTASWISPSGPRNGLCCSAVSPDVCVEFVVTLHPNAQGIVLDIASGAIPTGAMFYQVGCGTPVPVGSLLCLNGVGPHTITFCKPGNNPNSYSITSIPAPQAGPPIAVSDGCSGEIYATGYVESSITWSSLPSNPTYNSYMSCSAGCDTVTVTAQPGYPPSVLYQVCGTPNGACSTFTVCDTVRVYFVTDKTATILPQNPVICFGGPPATLTATGTGGWPPYIYLWSTGATTQSINVTAGTYWVQITDATDCPPVYDTVTVIAHPSPISANAGADIVGCANNLPVTLNGSVVVATGGIWSGGAGTFSPNNTTLNAQYTPSAGEISSGSVTLTLTSTGNGGCPPASDNVLITIGPAPTSNAGPASITVCADVTSVPLTGSVSVATGGTWTTTGTGTFSPNANTLNASYIPTSADTAAGSVTLTLTTTGNGTCLPVSDFVVVTFTNAPTANAGPNLTVCADVTSVPLTGIVTTATGGTWTTTGSGTFIPNANTLNASYDPSNADTAAGTVTLTLTTTGNGTCNAVSDQVTITFTNAPTANAGPPTITVCADVTSVPLTGSVSTATGGTWTTSGSGTFLPNANTLNASYDPSNTDTAAGSVTLTLTTTGNGTCNAVTDQVIVTFTNAPTVSAGPDIVVCADVTTVPLSGNVTTATGGTWTTSGSGTFIPNANTLNATYDPSNADTAAGSVTLTLTTTGNGTCNAVNDQVTITFTNAPTINAGPPTITVCADVTSVPLTGTVTTASGVVWSTSGSGTFSPNNSTLNASYIPSNADTAAGTVTLTLTSTGNGGCNAVTDQVVLTFTNAPTVSAGADITICADVTSIPLNGLISTATGGTWTTSGSGSFVPNATTLNANYIPSAGDTAAGTVTLTLTSTGNGTCNPVVDTRIITITPAPTVNAGADIIVCGDSGSVQLAGIITTATGGTWSTSGTGTFSPNNTTLNASYIPSNADTAAGSVTLTLVSTGNGTCNAVTDQVTLTFTDAPLAFAGADITLCADVDTIALTGSVTGATGGLWTTSGTGTFVPNATTLNASYVPSAADTAAGTVTLTLTTTGVGTCVPVSDVRIITITPAPTVTAGPDLTLCADVPSIALNGVITTASGGTWTSSGTGTFVPNANTLNATYMISSGDTAAGTITLTLTSTGNGTCNAVTDQIVVTITNAPVVSAGSDITICADVTTVPLTANITTAGGGQWTTSGSGSFTPNSTTINASYIPSAADTAAGTIILTLTSTGNGTCNAVIDSVILTITPAPTVSAGADTIVCADAGLIPLSGTITTAGGGQWTSSGTGLFVPSNTALNASYFPSGADTTAGTVTLTLTSTGNGTCNPVIDTKVITITPAPTVNAGADQTFCSDVAGISLNGLVTTATGGTWSSSGTGSFVPNANTLNATYVPSAADTATGTITLTLVTTGNGGCGAVIDSVTFTLTDAPVVNAGADQIVCSTNPNIVLNGTTNTPFTGLWTTSGSGTFVPNNTTLNAAYLPSNADTAAGTVTFVLTTTGNGTCGAVRDTMILTITPDAIAAFAGADQVVCAGSIALNGMVNVATGGIWTSTGTGTFTPSDTIMNPTYIFSSADTANGSVTLILTTTGNGGCTSKADSVTFTILDPIVVSGSAADTACANVASIPVSVTVSTGAGFWSTTGTGTFSPNNTSLSTSYIPGAADTAAGIVTVWFTSTNNGVCNAVMDSMTIVLIPAPNVAFSNNSPCLNAATNFTDLTTTVGTISGWNWSFGDSNSSTLQNPNHTYATDGSFTVTLTVTSSFGCQSSFTQPVTVHPNPLANFNSTAQCFVDSVYFTDASTINSGSVTGWTWDFGDSQTSGSQNPGHAYATAGTYTVTLIATSGFGCADTVTQTVTAQPSPQAGFSNTTVCLDYMTTFTDTSSILFGSIVSWAWDFGDGNNASTQNTTHTYSNPGTYNVSLIVTSAFGCVDTIVQQVIVHPWPVANFSSTGECLNVATSFFDNSTVNPGSVSSWFWDFGDGDTSSLQNPTNMYPAAGTYTTTLIVQTDEGCVDTISQVVTVNPAPVAEFDPVSIIVDPFVPVNFTDQSQANIVSWWWTFGDGVGNSSQQNPTYAYSAGGLYIVTEIVTNNFGCMDTVQHEVIVTQPPVVPSGFSPNGDGENDVFYVLGGPFKEVEMRIYNKWGELIFISKDQSTGWDGTRQGVEQPEGAYVYTIQAVTEDGEAHFLTGDITLLR